MPYRKLAICSSAPDGTCITPGEMERVEGLKPELSKAPSNFGYSTSERLTEQVASAAGEVSGGCRGTIPLKNSGPKHCKQNGSEQT